MITMIAVYNVVSDADVHDSSTDADVDCMAIDADDKCASWKIKEAFLFTELL